MAKRTSKNSRGTQKDAAAPVAAAPGATATRIAHPNFDWSGWQRIPVFSDGRLKPLDSLADETVNVVTGRSKWTDPDAEAAESAPRLPAAHDLTIDIAAVSVPRLALPSSASTSDQARRILGFLERGRAVR